MTELEKKIKAKIPGEDTGIEVKHHFCAICTGNNCGVDCYVKDGKIILELGGEERRNITTDQLLRAFHEQGISNDRILLSAE